MSGLLRHREPRHDGPGHRRGIRPVKHEPVTDMHGGLGDHPRRAAPVRPGRGMHHERMAQEDIPGLAGRVRDRPDRGSSPLQVRSVHVGHIRLSLL